MSRVAKQAMATSGRSIHVRMNIAWLSLAFPAKNLGVESLALSGTTAESESDQQTGISYSLHLLSAGGILEEPQEDVHENRPISSQRNKR